MSIQRQKYRVVLLFLGLILAQNVYQVRTIGEISTLSP